MLTDDLVKTIHDTNVENAITHVVPRVADPACVTTRVAVSQLDTQPGSQSLPAAPTFPLDEAQDSLLPAGALSRLSIADIVDIPAVDSQWNVLSPKPPDDQVKEHSKMPLVELDEMFGWPVPALASPVHTPANMLPLTKIVGVKLSSLRQPAKPTPNNLLRNVSKKTSGRLPVKGVCQLQTTLVVEATV